MKQRAFNQKKKRLGKGKNRWKKSHKDHYVRGIPGLGSKLWARALMREYNKQANLRVRLGLQSNLVTVYSRTGGLVCAQLLEGNKWVIYQSAWQGGHIPIDIRRQVENGLISAQRRMSLADAQVEAMRLFRCATCEPKCLAQKREQPVKLRKLARAG